MEANNPNKEYKALLQLIDDPDERVYQSIANKLISYGAIIIEDLEKVWEHSNDDFIQDRIGEIIGEIQFGDLQKAIETWFFDTKKNQLLEGALLVSKIRFPDLNIQEYLIKFEKLRKNLWLELNSTLSPLEQADIVNSIIFNFQKIKGNLLAEESPNFYAINYMLDAHQGNAYSIGILYLALCQAFEINIMAIQIPNQFMLAYIEQLHSFLDVNNENPIKKTQFFIDPVNGMTYTKRELNKYLNIIEVEDQPHFWEPINNKMIILNYLTIFCNKIEHKKGIELANKIRNSMPNT